MLTCHNVKRKLRDVRLNTFELFIHEQKNFSFVENNIKVGH